MKLANIRKLARDQKGLSTVEYTVLLVLIVAVSVGLWNTFGNDLADKLEDSTGQIGEKTDTTFRE